VGVTSSRVQSKAEEFFRLSKVKRPQMGKMEIARASLCVDCACRVCDESPKDSNFLRKFSGVHKDMYNQLLGQFQTLLNIRKEATSSIRRLAIQFGMTTMVAFVEETLGKFKTNFLESLPEERRAFANFDRPVFKAAAFFLCALKRKRQFTPSDKSRLLQLMAVDSDEFATAVNAMRLHCFETIGTGSKNEARDVTSHRQLIDNCKFVETHEDRINTGADDVEYEEWKQKVLSHRAKATSSSRSVLSDRAETPSKRKITDVDIPGSSSNDENAPKMKLAKSENAPAFVGKKKTVDPRSDDVKRHKKQPTIDSLANFLLSNCK
jgi:hypothetical protein